MDAAGTSGAAVGAPAAAEAVGPPGAAGAFDDGAAAAVVGVAFVGVDFVGGDFVGGADRVAPATADTARDADERAWAAE